MNSNHRFCRYCGKRFPVRSRDGKLDTRGHLMGCYDKAGLFCTMTCATKYAVLMASKVQQ